MRGRYSDYRNFITLPVQRKQRGVSGLAGGSGNSNQEKGAYYMIKRIQGGENDEP
jgi:hypothetical protein